MIKAKINGTELKISEREPLLAGSVGLSRIKFEFSSEWSKLTRQIDFTNEQSGDTRRISAQGSECTVPWELLRSEGDISCYVRGIGADGTLKLRTNDANLGTVLGSVSESAPGSGTPTPDVCDEVAAKLGDLNDLETEAKDNLVAAVNEAAHSGGGAEVFELTVAILSLTNVQSDKTFAEIKAAAVAGKTFRMADSDGVIYEPQVVYISSAVELSWLWENSGDWYLRSATINSDGSWETSFLPLSDDPVTEQTVSGWGFTKNSGTYSKPAGGIPKSDLASGVQASLGKADSALQSVPSTYRTAAAQDTIDSTKVTKVTGKGLSANDYTDAAKAKVDAIPASPKYTDTVYDDTALKNRVSAVESKLGGSGTVGFANVTTEALKTTGEVEIYGNQPHLDFHYGNSNEDYTTRIIETASGKLNISAPSGVEINGKKADTESVTLTVLSSRLTNLSYTAKYSELLGAVFVRIYGVVNAEMTSGTRYNILSIGSHKSGYVSALTVNCPVGCMASARADDNGNGVIALQPTAAGIKGKAVYITGFWFV